MQNSMRSQKPSVAGRMPEKAPAVTSPALKTLAMGGLLLLLELMLFPVQTAASEALILSEQGLGPITDKTPFDKKRVEGLLKGCTVSEGQGSMEGEPFPILKISDRFGQIASLNSEPDQRHIYSIVVSSNRVKNQLGPGIGTKYSAIYPSGFAAKCHGGAEEFHGKVFCLAPRSQHVYYQFQGPPNQHPNELIPSESELRAWTIQLIYWRP